MIERDALRSRKSKRLLVEVRIVFTGMEQMTARIDQGSNRRILEIHQALGT